MLGKHQRAHFNRMTREEAREAIRDFEKQIGVIAGSGTKAAVEKRTELEARIAYLLKRWSRGVGGQ